MQAHTTCTCIQSGYSIKKTTRTYRFSFSKPFNDWVNCCIRYISVSKEIFEGIVVVLIVGSDLFMDMILI